MAKLITKIKKNIRLVVQLCFTALSNGYIRGFTEGKVFTGNSKILCVPGLNCFSCPGALGTCPLGALQSVISSRRFNFSFYVLGFLVIFGALFGRFICGWLCPFGLVQDLLHKIPLGRKLSKLPGDKILKWLKYVIVAVLVIILPLVVLDFTGLGKRWFCQYLCPSGTLGAGIPLVLLDEGLRSAVSWLYAWKLVILLVIVLLAVIVYRPFCRYLCPLGAIYGCFNPIALYRYQVDDSKCVKCGLCQKACPMGLKPYEKPNSPECIRCGVCKQICPQGAISNYLKIKKSGDKK